MKYFEYKTIKLGTTGWFVGGNLDERKLDDQVGKRGLGTGLGLRHQPELRCIEGRDRDL